VDIHTNIHSVKYLCTSTSAAIIKLFRVSFSRKVAWYWKEILGLFIWLGLFSLLLERKHRSILTIRGKILNLNFFLGTVPKSNNFYTFPVRHILHSY